MVLPTTFDRTRPRLPVRLLNGCGAWLRRANRRPVSAEELIKTARHRCNLHDFGPGPFREALNRLIDSCEREAQLNFIGKRALRSDLHRTLCNRLLMQRDRALLPGIARQEIRAPLF